MGGLLVTGGGGFTGKHLCQAAINDGMVVHVLGRSVDLVDVYSHDVDIRDASALNKVIDIIDPDRVAHLAAISHVTQGSPSAYYEVNVIGTLNLLGALARSAPRIRSVLIASSAQVYGQPDVSLIDEQEAPRPINHYGASKLAMEHLSRTFADRLPINIVRPFNYTGAGQSTDFLVPKIVAHFAHQRAAIELGNLDIYREMNDVSAVVAAYLKILNSGIRDEIFNICSGVGHSPRQIIAELTKLTGHQIEVTVNPAFVRANEQKTLVGSDAHLASVVGKLDNPKLSNTLTKMLEAA